MYKNSNLELSAKLKVSADLGFQGIQKLHANVELPKKSSKLSPLSEDQKKRNAQKAARRVPIEHTNRICKIFKICGSRFRGKHKNYEDTWTLVAAIVNLKIATRHLNFSFC